MRFRRLVVIAITLALSSSLYAANPFVGKWKVDEAKSHIAGQTDSVAAAGPNTWKFQYGAFSWTITADGTDQTTSFGTTAMKVVNDTTWEFINKDKGRPLGTETWVLSADGQSIKRTFGGKKETGEPFSGYETVKRVSGQSGFEGTWESTDVKMTFTEVDIEANGNDGITLRLPDDGTHYSLKFDGKDYPEEGPRLPAGMTVAAKITGPREIQATTKLNGKAFDTEEWQLSDDGRTFIYKEHDAGTTNPTVVVLHRESGQ
jgi:hypothetical protein